MNAFFLIRKSDFSSIALLVFTALFFLPFSAFGQLAKADTGIIYGSSGPTDGGRLITIDKSSGDASVIDSTGLNNIPAIAITSKGNIFAFNMDHKLYKLSAESADTTFINTLDMFNLPAMAFNHRDELYGLGNGFYKENGDWNR